MHGCSSSARCGVVITHPSPQFKLHPSFPPHFRSSLCDNSQSLCTPSLSAALNNPRHNPHTCERVIFLNNCEFADDGDPAPRLPQRFVAALACPISDCDETYNYWEPAHFLLEGSGSQVCSLSSLISPLYLHPSLSLPPYLYL
jgi:hypothetical protein